MYNLNGLLPSNLNNIISCSWLWYSGI